MTTHQFIQFPSLLLVLCRNLLYRRSSLLTKPHAGEAVVECLLNQAAYVENMIDQLHIYSFFYYYVVARCFA